MRVLSKHVYLSHLAEKNVWSNKQSVYIWEGENWSDKLFKNYFSQQEWKLFVMFWWGLPGMTKLKYFSKKPLYHFLRKCLFRFYLDTQTHHPFFQVLWLVSSKSILQIWRVLFCDKGHLDWSRYNLGPGYRGYTKGIGK